VVPGPWSADDLAYQGKQLASMLTSNAGFTCGCPRVLVTHRAWNRRRDLLDALRGELGQVPHRDAYYPGARQRWEVFTDAHPEAELYGPMGDDEVPYTLLADLDPARRDDVAFRVEAFNTTIAETGLDAPRDAAAFVDQAVAWANETLWGTLAATILVHPRSLKDPAVAAAIDRAVANLRYGTVGVNVWALTAYGLASLPWGGYPGSPPHDIQSGRRVGAQHLPPRGRGEVGAARPVAAGEEASHVLRLRDVRLGDPAHAAARGDPGLARAARDRRRRHARLSDRRVTRPAGGRDVGGTSGRRGPRRR
jgi:hypothetical protein